MIYNSFKLQIHCCATLHWYTLAPALDIVSDKKYC